LPGALTEEDRLRHFEAFGTMPPKGSRYPDKRAVRITVNIPKGDPRLQRWTRWARKHCEPGVYDNLARADGEGSDFDHPDGLRHWRRSGQAGSRGKLQPAGR